MSSSPATAYRSPLLLGATGRLGSLILQAALAQQLHVTALVRDASKLAPQPNLRIVQGSPLVLRDVEAALSGCDCVVSALANARTSDMPWAAQLSPDWFMRDAVRTVSSAMLGHDLRRLVVVSSWGVGDDYPHTPALFRLVLHYSTLRHIFQDHTAVDSAVRASGLDWTLLRPVGFTQGGAEGYRVEARDSSAGVGLSNGTIRRALVAQYAVQALNDEQLVHKAPVMTQARAE